VILDVVFNHTAEGSELGPTLCFRGMDIQVRLCFNAERTGGWRAPPCFLLRQQISWISSVNYAFTALLWHSGWTHWHVGLVTFFGSAHASLQCFFSGAGTQWQAGWAHFDDVFTESPFEEPGCCYCG